MPEVLQHISVLCYLVRAKSGWRPFNPEGHPGPQSQALISKGRLIAQHYVCAVHTVRCAHVDGRAARLGVQGEYISMHAARGRRCIVVKERLHVKTRVSSWPFNAYTRPTRVKGCVVCSLSACMKLHATLLEE